MASFTPSRAAVVSGVVALVVAAGASYAVRQGFVDNATIGHACEAGEQSLRCSARVALHDAFRSLIPGFLAIAAALWCLWRPSTAALVVAVALAGIGLFLFNAWPGGLALTLVLLALGRPSSARPRAA